MLDTPLKEGLISTLYNVSGIMFSIGLGLIVSFNLSGIRNREYSLSAQIVRSHIYEYRWKTIDIYRE